MTPYNEMKMKYEDNADTLVLLEVDNHGLCVWELLSSNFPQNIAVLISWSTIATSENLPKFNFPACTNK